MRKAREREKKKIHSLHQLKKRIAQNISISRTKSILIQCRKAKHKRHGNSPVGNSKAIKALLNSRFKNLTA